jgi:hypothetical protein
MSGHSAPHRQGKMSWVDDHEREMWNRMLGAVDGYRAGRLKLDRLVSDLRGYFVEADPRTQAIRGQFEIMWSSLDAEWELRSEPWAPPGAANDQTLSRTLDEFCDWVRDVLSRDQTSEHS